MARTSPPTGDRWGPDDELGTLNLITDEVRARAVAQARTGRWVPLAMPVEPASMMGGPFAPATPASPPVQQALLYTGTPPMGMAEVLIMTPHHPGLTHLDALAHVPVDGFVYPGRPLTEAVTPAGVAHGSTTAFAGGVLTRGVLLDLAPGDRLPPAHPVTGADLDAAERRSGVQLEPGDAVVVRGGWTFAWGGGAPTPGMTVDAIAWMQRRDVSVYAGDIGDAFPPIDPHVPMPLHQVGLARLGMPLIDGAEVDELAAVCGELGRYAFLLTVAPPRLHGATGVPVNPLAIFRDHGDGRPRSAGPAPPPGWSASGSRFRWTTPTSEVGRRSSGCCGPPRPGSQSARWWSTRVARRTAGRS